MASLSKSRVVYVVGAGLSAGLGFPTVANLLPQLWKRLDPKTAKQLARVILFHHPHFDPAEIGTFPDIEQLLSEMQANSQLFDSSRPATGGFTSEDLDEFRETLLLELARWFHELKQSALATSHPWLMSLVAAMRDEAAQIVSFNWDLVLDELLFGEELAPSSYALGKDQRGPALIKPHGSLNWYAKQSGRHLKDTKRFVLCGKGDERFYAFKPFRAPTSSRREYMPFIVTPVYAKRFEGELSKQLWRKTVAVLSTATEVRFLGYSLPVADFHARFILRCGFHNQEHGALVAGGRRARATGRAKVTIVDPAAAAIDRVAAAVGWACDRQELRIADWVGAGGLSKLSP